MEIRVVGIEPNSFVDGGGGVLQAVAFHQYARHDVVRTRFRRSKMNGVARRLLGVVQLLLLHQRQGEDAMGFHIVRLFSKGDAGFLLGKLVATLFQQQFSLLEMRIHVATFLGGIKPSERVIGGSDSRGCRRRFRLGWNTGRSCARWKTIPSWWPSASWRP